MQNARHQPQRFSKIHNNTHSWRARNVPIAPPRHPKSRATTVTHTYRNHPNHTKVSLADATWYKCMRPIIRTLNEDYENLLNCFFLYAPWPWMGPTKRMCWTAAARQCRSIFFGQAIFLGHAHNSKDARVTTYVFTRKHIADFAALNARTKNSQWR